MLQTSLGSRSLPPNILKDHIFPVKKVVVLTPTTVKTDSVRKILRERKLNWSLVLKYSEVWIYKVNSKAFRRMTLIHYSQQGTERLDAEKHLIIHTLYAAKDFLKKLIEKDSSIANNPTSWLAFYQMILFLLSKYYLELVYYWDEDNDDSPQMYVFLDFISGKTATYENRDSWVHSQNLFLAWHSHALLNKSYFSNDLVSTWGKLVKIQVEIKIMKLFDYKLEFQTVYSHHLKVKYRKLEVVPNADRFLCLYELVGLSLKDSAIHSKALFYLLIMLSIFLHRDCSIATKTVQNVLAKISKYGENKKLGNVLSNMKRNLKMTLGNQHLFGFFVEKWKTVLGAGFLSTKLFNDIEKFRVFLNSVA